MKERYFEMSRAVFSNLNYWLNLPYGRRNHECHTFISEEISSRIKHVQHRRGV